MKLKLGEGTAANRNYTLKETRMALTEAPPIAAAQYEELRLFVNEMSARNDDGIRKLAAAVGMMLDHSDKVIGQLEVAQAKHAQLEARIDTLEKQLLSKFPMKQLMTHVRGSDGRIVSTTVHLKE